MRGGLCLLLGPPSPIVVKLPPGLVSDLRLLGDWLAGAGLANEAPDGFYAFFVFSHATDTTDTLLWCQVAYRDYV